MFNQKDTPSEGICFLGCMLGHSAGLTECFHEEPMRSVLNHVYGMTKTQGPRKLKHQVQDLPAGRGVVSSQTLSHPDSGSQPQPPGSTTLQTLEYAVEQAAKVTPAHGPLIEQL